MGRLKLAGLLCILRGHRGPEGSYEALGPDVVIEFYRCGRCDMWLLETEY